MLRLPALPYESATAAHSSIDLVAPASVTASSAAAGNRVADRLRDAWQTAVVFGYLLAAMTPQVRRVLTTLDKG